MKPRAHPARCRAGGFTLVEFMVAITVGLLMLAGVVSIFYTSRQSYRTQDSTARLQENARFGLSMMERDLRMAGFRGCIGDNPTQWTGGNTFSQIVNVIQTPTDYFNDFANEVQGFAGTGAAFLPAPPAAVTGMAPAPNANSDIVTVRGGIDTPIPVTLTMNNGNDFITIISDSRLANGQRVMVSNCVKASVFRAQVNTGSNMLVRTPALNSTSNLGWAYGPDAVVIPVETVTYYVGATSAGGAIPGGLSLYRQVGTNAATEMVEGVEQMRVTYGESVTGVTAAADITAERYVTAQNVANWNNVVAMRVTILFRSDDPGASPSAQTYRFNGVSTTATDRRIRRAYVATIAIRNRTK